jgi:non-homologous end joining protein Ku
MKAKLKTKIIYKEYEIPVELATMVKEFETKTEGCCPHCKGKTGAKKYCKECDEELGWTEPLSAYRFSKDDIHIITPEQLDSLKSQTKDIEILGSIPNDKVDMRTILGGQYLSVAKSESTSKKKQTEENANNSALFAVLYEGLRRTNTAIVVRFAVGSKQKLGLLIADQQTIILQQVTYKDEIVEFDEQVPQVDEENAELGVAFVNQLAEVDPSEIENESKGLLEKILKGEELPIIEVKKPSLNFFKAK